MKLIPRLRSLFRRPSPEPPIAPRVVVHIAAELLLYLAPDDPVDESHKLVAGTHNLSETGLAVLTSSLIIGNTLIPEGSPLRLALDLYPLGVVKMGVEVVRIERLAEEGQQFNNLLGLKITQMSHQDRARYLEYIGTAGWERVLAEGTG